MKLLKIMSYNKKKIKCCLTLSKWKWFLLNWVIIFFFILITYYNYIYPRTLIFPELGFSYIYPYLSAVRDWDINNNELTISFDNDESGGLIIGRTFSFLNRFLELRITETPIIENKHFEISGEKNPLLEELFLIRERRKQAEKELEQIKQMLNAPEFLTIIAKGREGGEIFELKIRNSKGESAVIFGKDNNQLLTKDFREYKIPLTQWENETKTGHDRKFDRRFGLDAFIIGHGAGLNDKPIEIVFKNIYITGEARKDWIYPLVFIILLLIITALSYMRKIYKTHFSVFISYSDKDKDFVNTVAEALTKNDIDVWLDKRKITIGDDYLLNISNGIKKSRFFLLIVSKNTEDSRFVGIETGMWLQKYSFQILRFLLMKTDFKPFNMKRIFIITIEHQKYVPDIFKTLHIGTIFDIKDEKSVMEISNRIVERVLNQNRKLLN